MGLIGLLELYGLVFVGDVRVGSDFLAIMVQGFKDYNIFSGQSRSIEGECDFFRTTGLFRSELFFCCNFFAVHQKGCAAGLVHEDAGQLVGLAGGQTGVADGIGDGDFLFGLGFLLVINCGFCPNFGLIGFLKLNRLVFVGNIRMNGHFLAFMV